MQRILESASGINIINTAGWWLDVPRYLSGVSANQIGKGWPSILIGLLGGKPGGYDDTISEML